MQTTLLLLKPSAVQRGIMGEVISRLEKKGLQVVGMKMMQLSDELLNVHYAHLREKPFFARVKAGMQTAPVVAMALRGVDAVQVVRSMAGTTNGRNAGPGTIRGDYSMSVQENIVHTADSLETAATELKRFFNDDELFDYPCQMLPFLYANDEV